MVGEEEARQGKRDTETEPSQFLYLKHNYQGLVPQSRFKVLFTQRSQGKKLKIGGQIPSVVDSM